MSGRPVSAKRGLDQGVWERPERTGEGGEGPAGATASLEDGESDHRLIVPLFLLLKNVPIYALKI